MHTLRQSWPIFVRLAVWPERKPFAALAYYDGNGGVLRAYGFPFTATSLQRSRGGVSVARFANRCASEGWRFACLHVK
jgi:hypothetical protein